MSKEFDAVKYEKIAKLAEELDRIGSNLESDELSFEEQEALETRQELFQHGQETYQLAQQAERKLRRKAIRQDVALMSELKRRGKSVDWFIDQTSRNPAAYQTTYIDGVTSLLDKLEGKVTQKKDSFFDDRLAKPHPETVQRLRESAKKSKGRDEDLDDQLKILGF